MANSWVLDETYIEPTTLTGAIRTALADLQVNQFTLSRWLPNVSIDDILYDFNTGGGGLVEAAVYRAWDAESRIGRREGVGKVMGELPPISEKYTLNEYDRLRLRKMDSSDAMVPFILRDATRIAKAIGARFELARGAALAEAELVINENGVVQTVTFGRDASHEVTAGILWSAHSTAVPITDMESWVETYENTNGVRPGRMLMPRTVFANLRLCDQMVNQVFPLATTGPMLSVEQVNNVLSQMDLPPVEIYDAQVKTDAGNTRVLPAGALIMVPPPGSPDASGETELGATLLGTTAESLEPEYGIPDGAQAGIVAATYKTKDPVRLWTHGAAVGMPVLKEPNLTFKATVL
jgi:hypothetical protein